MSVARFLLSLAKRALFEAFARAQKDLAWHSSRVLPTIWRTVQISIAAFPVLPSFHQLSRASSQCRYFSGDSSSFSVRRGRRSGEFRFPPRLLRPPTTAMRPKQRAARRKARLMYSPNWFPLPTCHTLFLTTNRSFVVDLLPAGIKGIPGATFQLINWQRLMVKRFILAFFPWQRYALSAKRKVGNC